VRPAPRPGLITLWKEIWYALYRRLAGNWNLSGWVRKSYFTGVRSQDPSVRLRYPWPHQRNARNRIFFRCTEVLFHTSIWRLDLQDCKSFPLLTGFVIPMFCLRKISLCIYSTRATLFVSAEPSWRNVTLLCEQLLKN